MTENDESDGWTSLTGTRRFRCPHCGETLTILLDLSVVGQRYIEDCEVCCNPIAISYRVEGDGTVSFDVRPA